MTHSISNITPLASSSDDDDNSDESEGECLVEETQLSEPEVENEELSKPEPPETEPIQPEVKAKPKPKPRLRVRPKKTDVVLSDDGELRVVLTSKKPGPKPKSKIVYVYREDMEEEFNQDIQIIEKVKRKPGRPKKEKPQVINLPRLTKRQTAQIVQEVNEEDHIVIDKKPLPENPTPAQLKQLELQEKILIASTLAKKPIRGNKDGKTLDGRQTRPRTPAQIKASENLVASNRLKRELKKQAADLESKEELSGVIKDVISGLGKAQQQKQATAKAIQNTVDLSIFG